MFCFNVINCLQTILEQVLLMKVYTHVVTVYSSQSYLGSWNCGKQGYRLPKQLSNVWCGESTESDEMDVCTLASDILGCICVCVCVYIYTIKQHITTFTFLLQKRSVCAGCLITRSQCYPSLSSQNCKVQSFALYLFI